MNGICRDHAAAVNARQRIECCITEGRIEGAQHRFQIAALDEVVAPAIGIMRQAGIRRLRIGKRAWLIGALVHRRTADFGEPDRLRLRHPGGR
jgi:hypothetical protein